jgi:hypothetical protein
MRVFRAANHAWSGGLLGLVILLFAAAALFNDRIATRRVASATVLAVPAPHESHEAEVRLDSGKVVRIVPRPGIVVVPGQRVSVEEFTTQIFHRRMYCCLRPGVERSVPANPTLQPPAGSAVR